jgi:hypothetical protein
VRVWAVPLIVLLISGCDSNATTFADSPASAAGETPVRYVLCSSGDRNCYVAARFSSFASCESHNELSGMLCDRSQAPARITCIATESTVSGYCTQ